MGFYFRRRLRLRRGAWLNLSRSGISLSKRAGRVTVNSRGRYWARLGGGLYARGRLTGALVGLAVLAALLWAMLAR